MSRVTVVSIAVILLAGCAWLPAAGPTQNGVIDDEYRGGQQRFTVIDVDYPVVDALLKRPSPSFELAFGADAAPPQPAISVGDSIVVSVWEANGGSLFAPSPTVAGSTSTPSPQSTVSSQVAIPEQLVLTDGTIAIPFVGRISVVGCTPQQVEERIRRSLLRKATDPQIMVTVTKSVFDTISVNGEAVSGMRVPLSLKGDRILDVIATSGGIKTPAFQTYVRLTRKGVTVTIPFSRLVNDPHENIYVWPGDVLTVISQPIYFEAFGATGQNAEISFDGESMNVSQAVAKSSGLLDERADATGVFLLRFEPRSVVATLAPLPPAAVGDVIPVVYRFDFSDMQSYFLAQRFPMQDKDIIYVANAQSGSIAKFFQLFGTLTAPVVTGAAVNASVH